MSTTTGFDLDQIVHALHDARRDWRTLQQRTDELGGRELPSIEALRTIIHGLRGALFPMRLGPAELRQENEDFYVGHTLGSVLHTLFAQIRLELRYQERYLEHHTIDEAAIEDKTHHLTQQFAQSLPNIRRLLDSDVLAALAGDPATQSVDEILLCYPGIQAMIHYRIAHPLYALGVPMLARMISELAHSETGIDIHPGAQIGKGCFIDHGTGVVIGETCIIGQNVSIYQAVTLGAKAFPRDEHGNIIKGQPRHPIVEDDVTIYAGATILGRITIGKGASIGGNVWWTHDVPAGENITQHSVYNRETTAPNK
ncbi:MAG: bacterial transferase hexapeptide family protein [Burkholderiaceae bacterium]|nr:bacterial transferase hexapeptide family protein [Burkholderiaceae bacterium]